MHEQTAAEWFESLGYRTLTGDVKYVKGYRGGTRAEADPHSGRRFARAPRTSRRRRITISPTGSRCPTCWTSFVDVPDAKFLLFESEPGRWLDNVYIKAQEAALRGAKCGCGGDVEDRVDNAMRRLGDEVHFCDVYPQRARADVHHLRGGPQRVGGHVRATREERQAVAGFQAAGGGHGDAAIANRVSRTDRFAPGIVGNPEARAGAPVRASRARARQRAQVAGVLVRVCRALGAAICLRRRLSPTAARRFYRARWPRGSKRLTELSLPIRYSLIEHRRGLASLLRARDRTAAASEQHIRPGRRPVAVAVASSCPPRVTPSRRQSWPVRSHQLHLVPERAVRGHLPQRSAYSPSPKPSEPGTAMSPLPPARMVRIPPPSPRDTPGGRMPS